MVDEMMNIKHVTYEPMDQGRQVQKGVCLPQHSTV